ncbi:DEAD/DEAH box helicase [Nocardioidaceae bacterium]|nr:DEAD/DEAH box helicase [Nocardioidaceae bacterium]
MPPRRASSACDGPRVPAIRARSRRGPTLGGCCARRSVTDPQTPDAAPVDFASLGLSRPVLEALTEVGYETPSPIQAATIPALMDGRDVVGLAQTGTGKTAAFALPLLSRMEVSRKGGRAPQALVLAPTRELALQVAEAFERYAAHVNLQVLAVYGGQAYGVQLSALRRGVDVVVGTPGRIMDHLEKGTLDLTELRYLVLDEADEMLNMGFAEDVETILADTPGDKQVALFSATMPRTIRRLAQQYLTEPAEISVKEKTQTATNIRQRWLLVSWPQKVEAMTRLLEVENFEGMIVFVRTKQATEEVAEKLRARGFSAAAINGEVPQNQRERLVKSLREAKLDILVATDVAARGLDVERITHVVNFDIPTDTESYVHRIGRTGRAGREGDAISFVTPRERHLLRMIEKGTRQSITEIAMPTAEDVNDSRVRGFTEAISTALESPQVSSFRDLIAAYVDERDVTPVDVAAALAVMAHDGQPLLLEPDPPPAPRAKRADRPPRTDRDDRSPRGDRGAKGSKPPRQVPSGLARYRIEVGKRHHVQPRQIVGALANEGGLGRNDFGHIDIRVSYSLVELPRDLSAETVDRLRGTRISGRLIELKPDAGPAPRRDGDGGHPHRSKKPRHKD